MTVLTDEINERLARAWMAERPRHKTEFFDKLLKEITDLNGDVWMAELMWVYWGRGALKALDEEIPAINPHIRWWKFGQKKNTVRSLLKEPDGKQWVWRMLHDVSGWM